MRDSPMKNEALRFRARNILFVAFILTTVFCLNVVKIRFGDTANAAFGLVLIGPWMLGCGLLTKANGRSAVLGALLGIFNIIGLLVICAMGKSAELRVAEESDGDGSKWSAASVHHAPHKPFGDTMLFRWLTNFTRQPRESCPTIELTPNGFVVTGQENGFTIAWSDVTEIFAFKIDLFSYDAIRLGFAASEDDTFYEVDESWPGYEALVSGIKRRFKVDEGWWKKVAFPAFEECRTTLWKHS